jgi:hypothetical protein
MLALAILFFTLFSLKEKNPAVQNSDEPSRSRRATVQKLKRARDTRVLI